MIKAILIQPAVEICEHRECGITGLLFINQMNKTFNTILAVFIFTMLHKY